jgi:homogentisate 1,2-dioxygenase
VHPGGYAHGPQPSAVEASIGAESFDELAVMVDTFRPLDLGEAGLASEDPAYAWTWAGRGPASGDTSGDASGDGGPALFSNS